MSSHHKFILFPQSLPAPELNQALGQASRLGHQQIRETVRHSSLPAGRAEQRNLGDGHKRRCTTVSNGADHMGDVDARPRSGGKVPWSRDPQLFPDPVPAKIDSSSPRAGRERGDHSEPRSHGLDEDKINEDFYFVSRSKMDMQLIDAQAHIAQTRSGSGAMVPRPE
ncbi:hypothetical protein NW757_013222 [Fusarium falciforme]|nr:hypothetical protein NW757_013222 [Fusarium falciforme]